MISIDELVEKKRKLKEQASAELSAKKVAVQPIAAPAASTSASASAVQSSSSPGRGVVASTPPAPAPAICATPAPVQQAVVGPAPQQAFTEEQILTIRTFSKANLLIIAQKLNIADVDAKTTADKLRVRIDRLFGTFTNLVVDAYNGTISFDDFEKQHFQQPTA